MKEKKPNGPGEEERKGGHTSPSKDQGTTTSAPGFPQGFLSPSGAPPARVLSSNSLIGEHIVSSARRSSGHSASSDDLDHDIDDDAHTTPPSQAGIQLSPPSLKQPEPNFASVSSTNSNPSRMVIGRPPRAPSAAVQVKVQSSGHNRTLSTGDHSFMSALTDPSDDEDNNIPRSRHDRGVSWEKNVIDVPSNEPQNAQMDDLYLDVGLMQPVLSDEPPPSVEPPKKTDVNARLAVADIVSPIESEAETNILRALEMQEKSAARIASAVLPALPDEAVENFQAHMQQVEQLAAAMSDERQPEIADEEAPATSIASGENLTPTSTHDDSSSRNSPNKNTDPKSKRGLGDLRKSQSHRRTDTAVSSAPSTGATSTSTENKERKLYNLATMMRAIHLETDKEHDEELEKELKKGHHRLASQDIGHPAAIVEHKVHTTQADTLANNAALLFRGRLNSDPEDSVIPDSSRHNLNDPKKNDDIIVEGDDEENDIEEGLISPVGDETSGGRHASDGNGVRRSLASRFYRRAVSHAKSDMDVLNEFLAPRKRPLMSYAKWVLLYWFLPVFGLSALLFYGAGNPRMSDTGGGASVSWFLMFLCIRQIITLSLARATSVMVIDFLALKTRVMLSVFGPYITLIVIQARGWPSLVSWWALYDLLMLAGSGPFPNHWLFYQNAVGLFNEDNPSGHVTSSVWNFRILVAALVIGLVVSIKRFSMGLLLGHRQYANYGPKLTDVIHRMIIISQVARLAREIEKKDKENISFNSHIRGTSLYQFGLGKDFASISFKVGDEEELDAESRRRMSMILEGQPISSGQGGTDTGQVNKDKSGDEIRCPYSQSLQMSERNMISQMLESWEEPRDEQEELEAVSIQGILQFKQTLAFMDLSFPFSKAFGLAESRESCVRSAQEVYDRLLLGNKDRFSGSVHLEILHALMRDSDDELDDEKIKQFVRIFRPERDGMIEKIDFVRSVDKVYKDLRLLRASIQSSAQIDQAFEALMNVAFYLVVFCIVLASWGIDPLALFLSLSSVIVAFAFAIGSASAKYFEGLMFILARRPYDIGDRISVNPVDMPPGLHGEFTWYVEKVTLYYTTLRLGATNEICTIANSSLSNCRIINAARSKKAVIYIILKFGIDVPFAKIQIFKEAVMTFVKARPREWLSCIAIRASGVESDLGFVEYTVCLQHRDSWQQIGNILESKAAITSYCLEVQKRLDMRYVAPPTPVDLSFKDRKIAQKMGLDASFDQSSIPPAEAGAPRHQRTQSEDIRRLADWFAPSQESSTGT